MKKNTYWKLVGLVVIVAGIALLSGCAEAGAGGGGGGGGGGASAEEAGQTLSTAFTAFSEASNETGLQDCIVVETLPAPDDATTRITFNSCTYDSLTINGQADLTSGEILFVYEADLTLTGAVVGNISWELTYSNVTGEFTGTEEDDGSNFPFSDSGLSLSP